jgi:hypothetical protein
MSTPEDDVDDGMAEPGKPPVGAGVGGMRSTADEGPGDATRSSMGHGGGPAIGPASSADASGGAVDPRATRATGGANAGAGRDDDDDEWRHPPVDPVDEQDPLKSLGRAVADVITGGAEDTSKEPER